MTIWFTLGRSLFLRNYPCWARFTIVWRPRGISSRVSSPARRLVPPLNGACGQLGVVRQLRGLRDSGCHRLHRTNYCTLGDGSRHIMGQSMGGSGALDLSLRHPGLFDRVCTPPGPIPTWWWRCRIPPRESSCECPESEPPTPTLGIRDLHQLLFLYSGAYSPNLGAPDSVDFPLDPYAQLVDSVYAEIRASQSGTYGESQPSGRPFIGLTWE